MVVTEFEKDLAELEEIAVLFDSQGKELNAQFIRKIKATLERLSDESKG